MGTFLKVKTVSGIETVINMDNIFQYFFLHASPNSGLYLHTSQTSLIVHTIVEAEARKMEKDMDKLLKTIDLASLSNQ